MFDPDDLARPWQELVQVATPACRVIPFAVAAHGRPVENRLDTAAKPAGSLCIRRPDGFNAPHDECRVDLIDRQVADDWTCEILERATPLLDMLRVAPAGCLRLDVKIGTLGEAQHVLVCCACCDLPGVFVGQGVDALPFFFRSRVARSRASDSVMSGYGPSPSQVSLSNRE